MIWWLDDPIVLTGRLIMHNKCLIFSSLKDEDNSLRVLKTEILKSCCEQLGAGILGYWVKEGPLNPSMMNYDNFSYVEAW